MPTMKPGLQFKDDSGEHGSHAASGASGGTQKQPADDEKSTEEGEEDEWKPPARLRAIKTQRPLKALGRRGSPKKTWLTSMPQI